MSCPWHENLGIPCRQVHSTDVILPRMYCRGPTFLKFFILLNQPQSSPTKPTVFAEWASGINPPLDPETIEKHVHAMVEVSQYQVFFSSFSSFAPSPLFCRQCTKITTMTTMDTYLEQNLKPLLEIFPSSIHFASQMPISKSLQHFCNKFSQIA